MAATSVLATVDARPGNVVLGALLSSGIAAITGSGGVTIGRPSISGLTGSITLVMDCIEGAHIPRNETYAGLRVCGRCLLAYLAP